MEKYGNVYKISKLHLPPPQPIAILDNEKSFFLYLIMLLEKVFRLRIFRACNKTKQANAHPHLPDKSKIFL